MRIFRAIFRTARALPCPSRVSAMQEMRTLVGQTSSTMLLLCWNASISQARNRSEPHSEGAVSANHRDDFGDSDLHFLGPATTRGGGDRVVYLARECPLVAQSLRRPLIETACPWPYRDTSCQRARITRGYRLMSRCLLRTCGAGRRFLSSATSERKLGETSVAGR